jgi:hypothetical protein
MAEAKGKTKPADEAPAENVATEATEERVKYGTTLTAKDGPVYVTLVNGTHLGANDLKVTEMERDEEGFGVYIVTELNHATGVRVRRMWIPYSNVVSIWQDITPE